MGLASFRDAGDMLLFLPISPLHYRPSRNPLNTLLDQLPAFRSPQFVKVVRKNIDEGCLLSSARNGREPSLDDSNQIFVATGKTLANHARNMKELAQYAQTSFAAMVKHRETPQGVA